MERVAAVYTSKEAAITYKATIVQDADVGAISYPAREPAPARRDSLPPPAGARCCIAAALAGASSAGFTDKCVADSQ